MLEMASMVCEKNVHEKLNHTPIVNDTDVQKYLGYETLLDIYFLLGNVESKTFFSNTLTEEGVCRTVNPISARFIFRDDTVDPEFLK
jgi:hypothetical protein